MATVLKPSPDDRLLELEAIQRPLTDDESHDLRRCLHAIYMRHWRAELLEREMNLKAREEHHIKPAEFDRAGVDAIADRMIAAKDESWLPMRADGWMKDARRGSDMLRDAILRSQARAREMAAA